MCVSSSGRYLNPSDCIFAGNSSSNGTGSFSLPIPTLIAISQALTALTQISLAGSLIVFRAVSDNLGESSEYQINA
jgi:hypothetical protein